MDVEVTDDKKKKEKRPHTKGSVASDDEDLTIWFHRFWARSEFPERVELWQMFGKNKAIRGERIYVQTFKPNEAIDVEQANKIAMEMLESAQNDADSARRPSDYQVAVVDRNRGAAPTIRRLGPVHPVRSYVVTEGDEDEAELPTGKNLALTYTQESLQAVRWERSRNDAVLGQVIGVLMKRLESSEATHDRLMTKVIQFFDMAQTAMDRSADREFAREREKFKLSMWQDGWRTARNLVPGLFASKDDGKALPPGEKKTTVEPERLLVDNFLTDVERSDDLAIKLFGDWDTSGEKAVLKTPGIFSVKQYVLLEGVRQGRLPIEELQKMMPKSTHELEITEEQIKAAIAAGVTEGMASALFELAGLLAKRAEEKK